MLEPLVKTIEVPCNQKKAFTVFMDMGSWWPKDKFATSVMRGHTVQALRVDAREGGKIVEVGSDRFTALGDDRTRVELRQSNWEALGDVAKMVQGGYRQAWVMIFEGAYKAACEA